MLTLSSPSSCILQWRARLDARCSAASEAAGRHSNHGAWQRESQYAVCNPSSKG